MTICGSTNHLRKEQHTLMVRMKVGGVRREETQYLWRINLCLCSPSARKNINLHYIITITSNIFITNSQGGAPHREPSRAVLLQQVRAHAQAGGGTPNPGPSRTSTGCKNTCRGWSPFSCSVIADLWAFSGVTNLRTCTPPPPSEHRPSPISEDLLLLHG